MNRSGSSGFTLTELLVAATLLTVVMTAVYASFSSSVRIWRHGEEDIAAYQDARLALTILMRELTAIVPNSWDLVEGSASELAWFAVTAPMDGSAGDHSRIMWIRYSLRARPNGGFRLLREERTVESPLPIRVPGDPTETDSRNLRLGRRKVFELCPHLLGMDIRYYWTLVPDRADLPSTEGPPASKPPIEATEPIKEYGLPQSIRMRLILADSTAEKGRTTFTSCVVFAGSQPRVSEKDAP